MQKRQIFVFGSNLGGYHGGGSAHAAWKEHGAIYGLGVGLAGNSYAIPTKCQEVRTLDLAVVKLYVDQFIEFAASRMDLEFNIVAIGCGLAGMKMEEVAPMFVQVGSNCKFLDPEFDAIVRTMQAMKVDEETEAQPEQMPRWAY